MRIVERIEISMWVRRDPTRPWTCLFHAADQLFVKACWRSREQCSNASDSGLTLGRVASCQKEQGAQVSRGDEQHIFGTARLGEPTLQKSFSSASMRWRPLMSMPSRLVSPPASPASFTIVRISSPL